jgi:hypothetical protein
MESSFLTHASFYAVDESLYRAGWVDGSIVNPTDVGRLEMLGCQKDGNPTYRTHAQ